MNHFSPKSSAERCSKERPDFHAEVVSHVRQQLALTPSDVLESALDVACGTGLSAKALLSIAERVFASDLSEEMLNYAKQIDGMTCVLAPAEKQPFDDQSFDLITVSSALHWFEVDAFFAECSRLLKPKAWLVIYNNYFRAEMDGKEAFKHWFKTQYLQDFPSPPRQNQVDFSAEHLSRVD